MNGLRNAKTIDILQHYEWVNSEVAWQKYITCLFDIAVTWSLVAYRTHPYGAETGK